MNPDRKLDSSLPARPWHPGARWSSDPAGPSTVTFASLHSVAELELAPVWVQELS